MISSQFTWARTCKITHGESLVAVLRAKSCWTVLNQASSVGAWVHGCMGAWRSLEDYSNVAPVGLEDWQTCLVLGHTSCRRRYAQRIPSTLMTYDEYVTDMFVWILFRMLQNFPEDLPIFPTRASSQCSQELSMPKALDTLGSIVESCGSIKVMFHGIVFRSRDS